MNPNSKEYKKLQATWYKKLAKSGFEDAEQLDGNLKEWHSYRYVLDVHPGVASQDSRAEYYRLAGHFLHSHAFENLHERQIWELHCEGKSVKSYRSRWIRSQWKVYEILNRLIAAMKESWKQVTE